MATSKSNSQMPTEKDLVAFEHGAAGHQGINTNASGSLLIKPCTAAEISFYESVKLHPAFQAHTPTFIGSLTLNNDPAGKAIAPVLEEHGATTASAAGVEEVGEEEVKKDDEDRKEVKEQVRDGKKEDGWVPSGGKKLTTGLAIVLENAAARFKRPNVLDVKLGARLWDDDAPEAKRKKLNEVAAKTTSGSLGFRIAGMKVWLGDEAADEKFEVNSEVKEGYMSFNKNYGQAFHEGNVIEAFARYLGGKTQAQGEKVQLKNKRGVIIAKRLLREIESIQYVLEHEESRMYSASILIVYEGDEEVFEAALKYEEGNEGKEQVQDQDDDREDEDDDDDDDDDEETVPRVLEVRLIDFAHAKWTPGQGPDENALRGVRNVVKILKELMG